MSGDPFAYMLELAEKDGGGEFTFIPFKEAQKKEWEEFSIGCPSRDVTTCNIAKKACKQRICYYEYLKKHLRMFLM